MYVLYQADLTTWSALNFQWPHDGIADQAQPGSAWHTTYVVIGKLLQSFAYLVQKGL
jgi:hypothetical protein